MRDHLYKAIKDEAPPGYLWVTDFARLKGLDSTVVANYCKMGKVPGAVKPFDRRWYVPAGVEFILIKPPGNKRGTFYFHVIADPNISKVPV